MVSIKSILLCAIASVAAAEKVNMKLTPGKLCTPSDPNYAGQSYGIAKCNRNVSTAEKTRVAAAYGIPKATWGNYEFDHLIPLGIGGSNDDTNLWPQPGPTGQSDSGSKDAVELAAYDQLSSGKITQAQAVQMILTWLNTNYGTTYTLAMYGLH